MAVEHLVDCTEMMIGATQLARPESADFSIEPNEVESASDAVYGAYENDITYYDLKASLNTQDPLAAGIVAALTDAYAIAAQGQLANAVTYRSLSILHGVLTGLSIDLVDNQPGKLRADFQNRAASATATLADEYAGAAGSAPTLVNRRGTIRIQAASSTFTPDGGDPVILEGLERVNWQAQADVDARSSPGAKCVDLVTVMGWRVRGNIALGDKSLTTTQTLAATLAVLARGALAVQCRVTGFGSEATTPADAIITLDRVKFGGGGEGLRTKGPGTGNLSFGGILRAANNDLLALADMVAVTEAGA